MIAAECVKKQLNSSHYLKVNMIRFADGFRSGTIQRFRPKQRKGGIAIYNMVRSVVVAVIVWGR